MSSEFAQFHIHYEVDEHFIPLQDFLIAAGAVQEIVDTLNKEVLGGSLKYKLVVMPPEEGTFRKTIGVVVLGSVILSSVSDYTSGVFEGVTGRTVGEYGKKHGEAIKDLTKNFFSKTTEELEKIVPPEINLDKAFKAKTEFYVSCQTNQEIKAIGFDNTKYFPIKRDDFSKYFSKDSVSPTDRHYAMFDVIVISPVTENKDYVWKFEDIATRKKISGHMRDKAFRDGVLKGEYPFKNDGQNPDKLTIWVMDEIQNGEGERKKTYINDVYIFNGKKLKPIPKDNERKRLEQEKAVPMDGLWKKM